MPGMDPKRPLMPDWMVSPAYGPDLTFGRIAINEGALCIECKACGREQKLLGMCEKLIAAIERLRTAMEQSVRGMCIYPLRAKDTKLYKAPPS
jgi:hypothetical protein